MAGPRAFDVPAGSGVAGPALPHTIAEFLYRPAVAALWRGGVGAAAVALAYQLVH